MSKALTRRERIDRIVETADSLDYDQRRLAWGNLCQLMQQMACPMNLRTPKFNDLLLAILRSCVAAKHQTKSIKKAAR